MDANTPRPDLARTRVASWAAMLERAIGAGAEIVASALVVIEACILLAGVTSRYVFHSPLVWSDELASLLFLWLGMAGAVVAYHRAEHLQMGAFVAMTTGRTAKLFEALSIVAALAFLLILAWPAFDYAIHEYPITTPAIQISAMWRALAMPVGVSLMAILGILRIARRPPGYTAAAALIVAAIAGGLALLHPLLAAIGNYQLIVFFIVLVGAAVLGGIPIAFAFGLGTFANLAIMEDLPLSIVTGRMDEGMSHLLLISVPIFVFLGLLIEITGMARLIVGFLATLIGHLRGGLHYVLVGAMYMVSGISGAKIADMAAVAPILFPEMIKRGAKPGELVALLSATGAQTETVPPSLVLITVGAVTGVSVGALFSGGILPSIVLGAMLCAVVGWQSRKEDMSHVPRATWKQAGMALIAALPALALPFLIRAAVVEGVATATEVSTVGLAYTVCYGIVSCLVFGNCISWARIRAALISTASLTGAVLLILATATAMAWALTQSGFSSDLADAMTHLPGGAFTFLAVSIVLFVILGAALEGIPAVVLFAPLMFPIAKLLDIDPIHYSMVMILSMGLGLFAPPFGVGYYAACAISRVDPSEGMKPILPYIASLALGVVLIAAIPWFSTALVR